MVLKTKLSTVKPSNTTTKMSKLTQKTRKVLTLSMWILGMMVT